jgi:hypothetical protein
MEKTPKHSSSEYYIPSSGPFRIYKNKGDSFFVAGGCKNSDSFSVRGTVHRRNINVDVDGSNTLSTVTGVEVIGQGSQFIWDK